jgi:hypothetical protein
VRLTGTAGGAGDRAYEGTQIAKSVAEGDGIRTQGGSRLNGVNTAPFGRSGIPPTTRYAAELPSNDPSLQEARG